MNHDKDKKGSSSQTSASVNNISVINRQLNVRPFQINENRTETASNWEKWLQNIERQLRYFGINDPEMKKDGLIIYGGPNNRRFRRDTSRHYRGRSRPRSLRTTRKQAKQTLSAKEE